MKKKLVVLTCCIVLLGCNNKVQPDENKEYKWEFNEDLLYSINIHNKNVFYDWLSNDTSMFLSNISTGKIFFKVSNEKTANLTMKDYTNSNIFREIDTSGLLGNFDTIDYNYPDTEIGEMDKFGNIDNEESFNF